MFNLVNERYQIKSLIPRFILLAFLLLRKRENGELRWGL